MSWRDLVSQGRFTEAEEAAVSEAGGPPGEWPRDPEALGWFYETWGDRAVDKAERIRAYLEADRYFGIFASWSTSGGEGTARIMDVDRVQVKRRELEQQG